MAINLPSQKGPGGRGARRAPMADINVTPLVDVMLVLLIIFMVTAPLLTAGVPVDLPDSRAKALEQDAKPINLSIERAGGLYLDEAPLNEADLPGILQQIAKKAPPGQPPQVFLRADRALDYGRVMAVMGELNRAGLNRVALVTTTEDGG